MTASFQIQHSAMLLKYSGISFISGAVNHGFFSGERSLWTAAVGIVLFVVGAWMEHRSQGIKTSLWESLWVGTLLSIGLGFFTGGLQHFPDSPARSAWVVPLGFAVSIFALIFSLQMRVHRALMVYALGLGIAVSASSWAAYQAFEKYPEWAAGGHGHGGSAADSHNDDSENKAPTALTVSRSINIDMNDTMRFSPDQLTVNSGETIKFVVHNSGKLPHEMVLGSEDSLKAHAVEMKQSATQKSGHTDSHDHGNTPDVLALSVQPGDTKEWVIRFDKTQTLQMACLIPGHFEAGMKGQLKIQESAGANKAIPAAKPSNAQDHSSHKH
jgi:uncharacterized cupredoxin-like copper-binding protein